MKIELTLILVSLVERTNHKHDLDGKPLYPLHEAWQGSNYKHAYIYTWNIATNKDTQVLHYRKQN